MEPRVVGSVLTVVILMSTGVHCKTAGSPLSDAITHFEPLFYDPLHLQDQHHRSKRSTRTPVLLNFSAFGRNFNITMHRDTKLFSPRVQLETSSGHTLYDVSRAYDGYLSEDYIFYDSKPTVRGIITATGEFQGTIHADNNVYVMERAGKYFKTPQVFHSVIYKASDVHFDFPRAMCGAGKHRNSLLKIQRSQNGSNDSINEANGENDSDWSKDHDEHSDWSEKYLNHDHKRKKRAIDPSKKTCELYLQADHRFYLHHGSDVETVIEELAHSVQTVNSIYGAIDFDENSSPDNINFVIKKIKVWDDISDLNYRLNGNFGVEKYLELHSEENYDQYCLSYIFTHYDFDGGVLGLAWTAGPTQSGGVCEKYKNINGNQLSLNTGLVTTLNYGKVVSSLVLHLTFAHEIGHNFGSPHDEEGTSCSPGGTSGNFIMYARATSGTLDNNNKFSTCSVSSMTPILDDRARSTTGCFVAPTSAICGNKVVEAGEECDCGWDTECTESCCNPQTGATGPPTPCTQKATSVCSPSSGPCCSATCQYVTAVENKECRAATSCLEAATCDGTSEVCPASTWAANKTPCGENQVCVNGTCSGSVCLAFNYPSCQCTPSKSGDWRDSKLCTICCEDGGQCKPSYEIGGGLPNGSSVAGSPCNDYHGYCDVFYRCREVNPKGTFSRIKNLLSPENLETIKQWLTQHWWVALLAGLGFIVLMVVFVKVCEKKVPSDRELYERRLRKQGINPDTHPGYFNRRNSVAPSGYM